MARYQAEYFDTVSIPVPQFQRDGIEIYYVRWTRDKDFQKTEDGHAD